MNNTIKEITENFNVTYGQLVTSKNRSFLRWEFGPSYVEVQVPGFKIGKLKTNEKRLWIVSNFVYPRIMKTGRTVYNNYTSSHEYSTTQLEILLNELSKLRKNIINYD